MLARGITGTVGNSVGVGSVGVGGVVVDSSGGSQVTQLEETIQLQKNRRNQNLNE